MDKRVSELMMQLEKIIEESEEDKKRYKEERERRERRERGCKRKHRIYKSW
jgi:hypothetical protein